MPLDRKERPLRPSPRPLAAALLLAAFAALALALGAGASERPAAGLGDAINLRTADLPGFTAQRSPSDASLSSSVLAGARRCQPRSLARVEPQIASSPFFARADTAQDLVLSAVIVQPSAEIARRYVAAAASRRVLRCTSRAAPGVASSAPGWPSITLRPIAARPDPFTASGSDGAAGVRQQMSMSLDGVAVELDGEVRVFAVGRLDVALFTYGIYRPFPADLERRLTALLLRRALAARSQ